MSNGSLDFLNMIKASGNASKMTGMVSAHKTEPTNKNAEPVDKKTPPVRKLEDKLENSGLILERKAASTRNTSSAIAKHIAVIDTETNWNNEVMSIGVAIANLDDFKCIDKMYYIITPEYKVGGYFSGALHIRDVSEKLCTRANAMSDIQAFLDSYGVTKILAYNAKFDYSHLKELSDYEWFDIMRLAAYKQYNTAIPDDLPCCKTGRLKTDYGVEPIMCLLTGDCRYMETHNAALDAVDELKIVELLGRRIEEYECGRING